MRRARAAAARRARVVLGWAGLACALVCGGGALCAQPRSDASQGGEAAAEAKARASYVEATRALVCNGYREGGSRRDAQREAKAAAVLRGFGFSRASYAAAAQRFSRDGTHIDTAIRDDCDAAQLPSKVWTAQLDTAQGDRSLKGEVTVQVRGSRVWGRLRVEAGHVRFGDAVTLGLHPPAGVTPKVPHVRLEGHQGDEVAYRLDVALEGEALVGELVLVYATGERYVAPVRAVLAEGAGRDEVKGKERPKRLPFKSGPRGKRAPVIY